MALTSLNPRGRAELVGALVLIVRLRAAALVFACLAVSACDSKAPPTAAEAAALHPADPALARLYAQSCKACHANPASGAPLVHDHEAWEPRWDKGLDVLTQHAVEGFQAMPAGGQCATCTARDYRALIRFMADHEKDR